MSSSSTLLHVSQSKWFSGSGNKDVARDLFAGMAAGFACKFIEYPADTVKVLMQTGDRFAGPIDCFRKTLVERGPLIFYQGLTAPLLGSMAEISALFVSFRLFKRLLGVRDDVTVDNPNPFFKLVIAGGGTGFASAAVLTPVELIKCRMQAQIHALPGANLKIYKGPIDCIARTVRAEGVQGLFRGSMSTLAREVPGNMVWFGAYEGVLRLVQERVGYERKKDVPLHWCALGGACAGVSYWTIPYPADTVKSKIQTDERYRGHSFMQVFRAVVNEEGVRGLYRGLGVTACRAAPAQALCFYAYEVAERFLFQY